MKSRATGSLLDGPYAGYGTPIHPLSPLQTSRGFMLPAFAILPLTADSTQNNRVVILNFKAQHGRQLRMYPPSVNLS